MKHPRFFRRQRGFGLFDGVVSLALLAFGMLALTRFELRLGGISNESAQRMTAAVLADELLNAMLTDNDNANCYTLPAVTPCNVPAARAATDAWLVRVMKRLPNAGSPTSIIGGPAPNRITVTLSWCHKDCPAENRTHRVQSDIR